MSKVQGRNPFRSPRSGEAGFTLIELMVVVAIIAILAAIGVPKMIAFVKTSETAEATEQMGRISQGLRGYIDTHPALNDGQLTTALDGRTLNADGTGNLSARIPHLSLADNANFNYVVNVIVGAAAGATTTTGDLSACIVATHKANAGIVYYTEAAPTAAQAVDWEGRIFRAHYVDGTTLVVGGNCDTAGAVQTASG